MLTTRLSKNLIDEGQFGAPIILTAFNYAHGIQSGVELTASYDRGPLSLYGNLAWSRAMGKDINSAQFNFSARRTGLHREQFHSSRSRPDLEWLGRRLPIPSIRTVRHPTRVSADLLVQSGLRASTATIPNGMALPTYATVNLSAVQQARDPAPNCGLTS